MGGGTGPGLRDGFDAITAAGAVDLGVLGAQAALRRGGRGEQREEGNDDDGLHDRETREAAIADTKSRTF